VNEFVIAVKFKNNPRGIYVELRRNQKRGKKLKMERATWFRPGQSLQLFLYLFLT
jgi:hypothetical protein